MTHIAGKAPREDSQILHAAIGLGSQIRAASEEIEQGRRIPPPLAAAMKGAGVFGMVMPRAWGGPELDPMTQFRVIEALSMVDGSVGWCAMIGCEPNRMLDDHRRKAVAAVGYLSHRASERPEG
jgi:indole-3-acetate monooxygenase